MQMTERPSTAGIRRQLDLLTRLNSAVIGRYLLSESQCLIFLTNLHESCYVTSLGNSLHPCVRQTCRIAFQTPRPVPKRSRPSYNVIQYRHAQLKDGRLIGRMTALPFYV